MNGNDEAKDLAPSTAIAIPEDELETRIQRAEKLADALDRLRAVGIKRTVPGDWKKFGDNLYLEGDGATRIAPVFGIEMTNVRDEQSVESGVVTVKVTADFYSRLFQVGYLNVSRSRSSDDEFLSQRGKIAPQDVEVGDVSNSAYKGCLARGVQLCSGLAGLTQAELESKYSIRLGDIGKVEFKQSAATADKKTAQDERAEIDRILHKIAEGDKDGAADILETLTRREGKDGWPGKRAAKDLTENGVKFALPKLRAMEAKYDADMKAAFSQEPVEKK